MKKLLIVGLLALTTLAYNAQALTLQLGLAIDASGSISTSDYNLQRDDYVAALTTYLPTDSSVELGVWQFGGNVVPVIAPTVIDSAATKATVLATLAAMTRALVNTGSTGIGNAIAAVDAAFADLGVKRLIDVSTDGANNTGTDPVVAATAALASGTTAINGLGIGAGAPNTTPGWVMGPGSFYDKIDSFTEFNAAVANKLRKEIHGTPDAGCSLALLVTGLLGLGVVRRTRTA